MSDDVKKRIRITPNFIRGYLETKGTFFKSHSRNSEFWRFAISGLKDDIHYLKQNIESKLGIKLSEITQREERIEQGIISKSFRVFTQARNNVARLVEYMYDDELVTEHLKHAFDGFKHFHSETPFNRKTNVFKHYKSAVGYMARELGMDIKGMRGVSAKRHQKPIFLWKNGEVELCFNNYEKTYFWLCDVYFEKLDSKHR